MQFLTHEDYMALSSHTEISSKNTEEIKLNSKQLTAISIIERFTTEHQTGRDLAADVRTYFKKNDNIPDDLLNCIRKLESGADGATFYKYSLKTKFCFYVLKTFPKTIPFVNLAIEIETNLRKLGRSKVNVEILVQSYYKDRKIDRRLNSIIKDISISIKPKKNELRNSLVVKFFALELRPFKKHTHKLEPERAEVKNMCSSADMPKALDLQKKLIKVLLGIEQVNENIEQQQLNLAALTCDPERMSSETEEKKDIPISDHEKSSAISRKRKHDKSSLTDMEEFYNEKEIEFKQRNTILASLNKRIKILEPIGFTATQAHGSSSPRLFRKTAAAEVQQAAEDLLLTKNIA